MVMTYRTGNHWGITIVRESMVPNDNYGEHDELVAVVVNGDKALAERICTLLNERERESQSDEERLRTHA